MRVKMSTSGRSQKKLAQALGAQQRIDELRRNNQNVVSKQQKQKGRK